jgi:uncharacterized membrane protein
MSLQEFDERGRGLDRILAFSDGVFAIAITLLVLNFKIPNLSGSHDLDHRLLDALAHDGGLYVGFVVSFFVVARFWVLHHSLSLVLRRADTTFIALNLVFLACIVFVPFPAELLGVYGNTTTAVVFYASALVVTSLMSGLLWHVAFTRGLTDPKAGDRRGDAFLRTAITAGVFGASIPIAFVSTDLAKEFWILLAVAPFALARRRTRTAAAR